MRIRSLYLSIVAVAVLAAPALALSPDDELWIPAAARGAGSSGSFWVTDVVIMNLSEEDATVEITWLERGADNSEAEPVLVTVEGEASLALHDIILETFGMEEGAGAIHIEVAEEGGDDKADENDIELVANARIYSVDEDGETVGQGFEGLISDAAVDAEDDETTHVIGVRDDDRFRANWYGLNITMDDETDEPGEAEVMVEVLDDEGEVLASTTFTMQPLEPQLGPVSALLSDPVENATLRFTMVEGQALFGASVVDDASNDPTTLEAHWDCEGEEGEKEFTSDFFTDDCTFVTTGTTTWWILEPGLELVLEGEEEDDEGELVELEVIISVLDETEIIDGVECRVVEERESEDGELVEVSRNFWALCQETGDIFYFGEDVDDYEDGVVVGHEGAWRAGVDGAEPGIIVPGRFVTGMRYYQEIAPGVALDRAEHGEMGLTVETEAGTFADCALVMDSSDFEPDADDEKTYCPGVGQVTDQELELVAWTNPTAP